MNEVKTAVPLVPTIPREVAEAIERMRESYGWDNDYMLDGDNLIDEGGVIRVDEVVYDYIRYNRAKFAAAIINGYTVEKSAEELAEEAEKAAHDKIRKRYKHLRSNAECGNDYARTAAEEICDILNVLNVKITEVNA